MSSQLIQKIINRSVVTWQNISKFIDARLLSKPRHVSVLTFFDLRNPTSMSWNDYPFVHGDSENPSLPVLLQADAASDKELRVALHIKLDKMKDECDKLVAQLHTKDGAHSLLQRKYQQLKQELKDKVSQACLVGIWGLYLWMEAILFYNSICIVQPKNMQDWLQTSPT